MKNIALTFILALLSLNSMAQRVDYLTLRTADGNEQSIKIDLGTVITFNNGMMTATTAGTSTDVALADLTAFFFATQPSAINQLMQDDVRVSLIQNKLSVVGPVAAQVHVFATDGRLVGTFTKAHAGAETFGVNLPHGVYVVKVGGLTQKIMLR